MPKIDSFKKKTYRSWDNDLLSSLKIKSNHNPDLDKQIEKEIESTCSEVPEQKAFKENKKTIDLKNSHSNKSKIAHSTNRVQAESKQGSSRVQTGFEQSPSRVQAESKQGSSRVQAGFKQGSSRVQNLNDKADNSVIYEHYQTINKLPRSEQLIFKYVVQICQTHDCLETGLIPSSTLNEVINSTKNSRETAIKRLIKKGLLIRKQGNARQGTINLALLKEIKEEAIRFFMSKPFSHSQIIEIEQTGFKDSPSSSSNINTTTTELPPEWKNINIDGLIEHGFNNNHVQQIANLGILTPDDLQQSIDYFVFDLLENNKASEIKKSPVAFFMGILRGKGLYTAPPNYESVKDRVLRLKTEQLNQQQEKREKMEAELIQAEFKIWVSGITFEEKEKLMPEEVKNSRFSAEKEGFFRTYFKEKFWPTIQQEKYADCF